jgi:hypothetical protein
MKLSKLCDRFRVDPGTLCFNSGTDLVGCFLPAVWLVCTCRRPFTGQDDGVSGLTAVVSLASRMLFVKFFNVARTRLKLAACAGDLA